MKVLMILCDTTRADHLGCYGYTRDTSPNIDRLAEGGVLFTNCFSADTPCVPSAPNKFTGHCGTRNGVVTHGLRGHFLRDGSRMQLQEILSTHGHRTCAVSTLAVHAPFLYPGWHEYCNPNVGENLQWVTAQQINSYAIPWLKQHADEDFFLFVHYWDPHSPYQHGPEEDFKRFYGDRDPSRDDGRLDAFFANEPVRRFHQDGKPAHAHLPVGVRDLDWALAWYDAEIAYMDRHIGRLLDTLRDLGIEEETMVILLADHGEQFGEMSMFFDHPGVYEPTQRVPLIVRWPARWPAGVTCDALVSNCDLMPTILSAAGIDTRIEFDGTDLQPLVDGRVDSLRERLLLGHGLWTAQRGVREQRWKFVRTYDPGFWTLPQRALYDMSGNGEAENVIDRHPQVAAELEAWMLSEVERILAGRTDPLALAMEGGLESVRWVDRNYRVRGERMPEKLGELI